MAARTARTRKRLTRAEQRAATRAAVLEAAARVFARRGLAGASVEEITEEAGFSRGAFYSNFDSKEELFLTLIEGRTQEHMAAIARAFAEGETPEERVRNGGRFIDALVTREHDWCKLYMEFWANATRNPRLRSKFAAQYRGWRAGVTQVVEAQAHALGIPLDTAPEELASTFIALFEGYMLQKLIDPGLFDEEFFGRLLLRFFGRLAALDRQQRQLRSQPR